jgi:hypothetical protein
VALSNGPTPGGSVIGGAGTRTLSITGVVEADQASGPGYVCRVTGADGTFATNAATLVVNDPPWFRPIRSPRRLTRPTQSTSR